MSEQAERKNSSLFKLAVVFTSHCFLLAVICIIYTVQCTMYIVDSCASISCQHTARVYDGN